MENTNIQLSEEFVLNTYGTDFVDDSSDARPWDVHQYCENAKFDIVRSSQEDLEFDLIGVDPPISNAIRRVLLAEVPTVAIEKVLIHQNTSLIQDEVLAHRLGLLPIKADPRLFDYKQTDDLSPSENSTLVFNLQIKCKRTPGGDKDSSMPEQMYDNSNVYTKHFTWEPVGNQAERFASDPPRPVNDDILIAKLRPGQEIDLTCHCVKGIGRDHAKFSSVATASYRLLPDIRLKDTVEGEAADCLKACFSKGVIDVKQMPDGRRVAEVVGARNDMCSRNVFRHPDLAQKVVLTRNRRHFIFSVESTGALLPETLVTEAMGIVQGKCQTLLDQLKQLK